MVVAVKTSPKELTQQRVVLGTAREAMFYNDFAPRLGLAGVPKSYYAEADMATGAMLVILECKQNAVPAGVFFGPGGSKSGLTLTNSLHHDVPLQQLSHQTRSSRLIP